MRRPMTARAAVMALLALLLVLPGTAAAAAWLSPVHFGGTTGAAPSPAVDASGNAVVGWQAGSPSVIQAARHAVGTPGFSGLPNLSPTSAFDAMNPVVVVSRSGSGLAAWVQTTGPMPNDKEVDIVAAAAEWHDRRSDEGRLGGDESEQHHRGDQRQRRCRGGVAAGHRGRSRDAPGVERHVHAHDDAGHA